MRKETLGEAQRRGDSAGRRNSQLHENEKHEGEELEREKEGEIRPH
jgi:hypothetical protein